ALVLVYVGAVMVLFLFVVMMLDVNFDRMRERFRSYIPVGFTVGLLVLVEMGLVLVGGYLGGRTPPAPATASYSNTRTLGLQIYTDYAYPFEIAAMILLVAIIAAIALTHRRRRATKYQHPGAQVLDRRNVLIVLLAFELMLLAVNLNFVACSRFLGDQAGQVFVFFILTVAAAESAIGLAILVLLFRNVGSIDVEDIGKLRG